MGKLSLRRDEKKGGQNPVILPPMQTLKPLTEIVTTADSPVKTSKSPLKKYVSPLSLTWQRSKLIEETNKPSSPSKTENGQKPPETVTSNGQDVAAASTSLPTEVTPTSPNQPNKRRRSCDSSELGNMESSFKISEGAFNISRIRVASTPVSSNGKSSDNADFIKIGSGENKLEENSSIQLLGKGKSSAKKKKRKRNLDSKNSSSEENKACPPSVIETIDLDLTNDSASRDIELVTIKKKSDKPIEFVDLSATLDDMQSAPSGNDTIIIIDDDQPVEPNPSRNSGKLVSKRIESLRNLKNKKESKQNRLLKIQPHPNFIKKKERKRKKKSKPERALAGTGQDDVCFLGTGISLRPPIRTASNAAIQPAATVPSSAGSSTENPQLGVPSKPSIYGSNFDNPNSDQPQTGLRPIVIDGSNVAMDHGKREKVFSSKGVKICVDYFLKRGHKVYCFIPLYRKSDPFTKDRHILDLLEQEGHVIFTPSRYVGSNAIVPYDDRYIVQIAAELGGVIISRDNFRDLMAENPIFKETIVERTLMYTWVGDIIMFPSDPFGRRNVSLDKMLRF